MKKSKQILALLLSFILCVSLFPAAALAEGGADFGDAEEVTEESAISEDHASGEEPEESQPVAVPDSGASDVLPVSDDPDEKGCEEAAEEVIVSEPAYDSIFDDLVIYTDAQSAGKYMREQMKNHVEKFSIGFVISSSDPDEFKPKASAFAKAALTVAEAHTDACNEGDYISLTRGAYEVSRTFSTNESTGETKCRYDYTIPYYDTIEQEEYVANRVDEIFNELDINNLQSDYEKVKAIYTWICSNVTYDNEHKADDTYVLKATAYAALANGTAVCQGYANLFYYMALKAGIDARSVTGVGGTGSDAELHAWNIVQLDGVYYYNLDATWDAHQGSDFSAYQYFLRSNDDFPGHTRDDSYTTEDFNNNYPMAETSYSVLIESGSCGDGVTWEYYLGGVLNISGEGAMTDYDTQTVTINDNETQISTAPWVSYRKSIKTVRIGEGVTRIGSYAFYKTNTKTVSMPESLTSIGDSAFGYCYLTAVTLPAGLSSIGKSAFFYCDLTEITIPAGVESIGDDAFDRCVSLTAFAVDENNSAYSSVDGVLFNKDRTVLVKYPAGNTAASYTIPNTVATVGYSAFSYASGLTEIVIPRSVTKLELYTFYNCTGLTGLNIPESVTVIRDGAFSGCSNLTSLTFWGDMPGRVGTQMFKGLDGVTVYYPTDGKNWENNKEDYEGTNISWVSFTPLLGDCNTDGVVNLKDLLILKKAIADNDFSNIRQASADLYPDGSVNLKDLLALKRQLTVA